MTCRLPYGRRLSCYWLLHWYWQVTRLRQTWIVDIGRVRVVLYGSRMDWLDADRAVERRHQQRKQERGR